MKERLEIFSWFPSLLCASENTLRCQWEPDVENIVFHDIQFWFVKSDCDFNSKWYWPSFVTDVRKKTTKKSVLVPHKNVVIPIHTEATCLSITLNSEIVCYLIQADCISFLSSFLNAGLNWPWINYDNARTVFDNALVTIKKQDIFYAILQVFFRTKTHFASLLATLSCFASKCVPRHPTCTLTATVKYLTLGDKPTKEIRSQTRNVAKRNNISNTKIFISEVYPKLYPIKKSFSNRQYFLWCPFYPTKKPLIFGVVANAIYDKKQVIYILL